MPGRHLRRRQRADLDATGGCRRSSSSASASTRTSPRATTSCSTAIMLGLSPREARARYDARDRLRRARGVRGPEAQELLLGDARAPRVLGGDPGRRRHPADRRGARRRRRRLPAEVLRRVQPDARRGPTIVFVTHDMGVGQALLPPRAAARARRDGAPRRAARGRRPLPGDQLRARSATATPASERARRRRRGARRRGLVEDERGERQRVAAAGPADHAQGARRRSRSTSRTRRPAVYVLNEDHVAIVVATHRARARAQRALPRRRARSCSRSPSTTCSRPGRYNPLFTLAHRGVGPRRDRPLRGRASRSSSPAPRRMGGARRPAGRRRRRARVEPAPLRRSVRRERASVAADAVDPVRAARAGRSAGPRALTDDWSRFWHLTYNIARNEFKLRFFGSVLGYLWQLMRPLLLFGVLYVFFTKIVHVNKAQGPAGKLLRRAAARLDRAVHVLRRGHRRRGAQRRRPREPGAQDPVPAPGDPAVGRAARAVQPGAEPGRRADLRADRGRAPDAQLAGAAADPRRCSPCSRPGMAMLLSALFVHFRDIQPIWEVVTQILFYASPGDHPARDRRSRSSSTPGAAAPLHAQPAGGDLPAVPPRDDQPRRRPAPARRSASWAAARAARRSSLGDLRARLLWSSTARRRTSPRTSESAPGSLHPAC